MKSLQLGDIVWADGYIATVYSLPNLNGDMQIFLDDCFCQQTIVDCNIRDITLDSDGEWELSTEFVPVVGDTVTINEKEFQLVDIDDGVATLKRDDEIRYYSFCDIEYDIINGYWISSMCEQVLSPTVKRKLKFYEVQDSVYLYNSLGELKEIYELLGKPHIAETYEKSKIDTLIDSLKYGYGLIHYWEDYDSDYDYMCKYIKVIQGATFIEDKM